MRSAEIRDFPECGGFDRETGMLRLKDRKLFLPPVAARALRRILSLPEANDKDFLRLDDGFVRRSFYEIAREAGLPEELCAPRALRKARAKEMLF